MNSNDPVGSIGVAVELERDVRALGDSLRHLVERSDVTEVINSLRRAQLETGRVYTALAVWHGARDSESSAESDPEHGRPRNPAWRRAEVALEEAAQYTADAAAALARARDAALSARWFEEIRTDE
ncbi:hypothetical protein OVN20_12905 [Microcella daejeonensis]|uniref:hypothetical protein n=1 Tax=Microcella daejeonensis TaxID=2994971 RepID=UPI00226E25AD|nr:hypothetical protein [Microcella daejeonensis]WAB83911.1 hypothetical protein OVN20_12905 [Microcella daejeonensis]